VKPTGQRRHERAANHRGGSRQKGSAEDVDIGGGAPTYQVSDGTAVVQVGDSDEVRYLDPLEPAALGSPDE
jgi:hypothetical protein